MTKKLSKMTKAVDYDSIVDDIAEALDQSPINLSTGSNVQDALSTGSLVVDLITGGGYLPGAVVIIQGESGSGKSTFSYFSVKSATKGGIPCDFKDHEGSTDPRWLERIIGMPMTKIMGTKDDKGKYIVQPLMRYSQPTNGEDTFRYIKRVLQALPDKTEKNGKWYCIYKKDMGAAIFKKAMSSYEGTQKKDKFYVEAADGKAQVLFYADSLASMLPEAREADDDSSPMAKLARMFSDSFPLVKSFLARKRATLVCTNQMRLKPMSFGDPRYPVGGEAPKFYSDLIIDLRPVSPSTVGEKGKGGIMEEDCWDGKGIDRYKFSKVFIPKNKKFAPFRSSVIRIWFEHKGDSGYGIDPVYDCLQYLRETGQVDEGKVLEITVPGLWTQRKWKYLEFKELILNADKIDVFTKYGLKHEALDSKTKEYKKLKAEYDSLVEKLEAAESKKKPDKAKIKEYKKKIAKLEIKLNKLKKSIDKILKNDLDLISACRKQLEDGSAFPLYFNALSGIDEEGDDDEDDDDSDVEDDDEF